MNAPAKPKEQTKNAPAVTHRKTALALLSERLNVPAEQLKKTLMSTAFATCRNEDEFLSAVIVANEYKLNPFTKEIYAFPSKQGGVIPIVSTDGWNKLMTTHPDYKSHEYVFADEQETLEGAKPCPIWCEVVIHKQDGSKITIREYLDEVYRPAFVKEGRALPGPWQTHTKRMLRHKTKIQCAREAFGFGGIYDEDEGKRIIEAEAVVSDPIPAPRSISGNGSRSEDRPVEELKKVETKPNATIKGDGTLVLWSEALTTMRTALGDGEFFSILAWHNIHQPGDITDLKQEETILAEMKASLSKKQ